MSPDDKEILSIPRLPARLDTRQTATLLGFGEHDIQVLMRGKLLHPLGKPAPNAHKYFSSFQIVELCRDVEWLNKATKIVSQHWQNKNQLRRDVVNS